MRSEPATALLTLTLATAALGQDAVQWRVEDGGNGHWYRAVFASPPRSPESWFAWATSNGGHVATVTSQGESEAVFAVATQGGAFTYAVIGGRRDSNNAFRWITGEPWSFTAWSPGEPSCTCERYLMLYPSGWNDTNTTARSWAIVEHSADCNGDGIVDFGQVRDGSLPDANGNSVPDCCDQGIPCLPCVEEWCECPGGTLRRVPSAYPTIQSAISAAASGDCIAVDPGTYVESLSFLGKSIRLRPAGPPGSVTISAPAGSRAITFTGGEGPGAVVEGFRLPGAGAFGPIGGGIRVANASPTIEGCEIVDVHAPVSDGNWGGAVDVVSGAPVFRDCIFRGNRVSNGTSGRDGGAALVRGGSPRFENCLFRDNPGGQGADLFLVNSQPVTATLAACTFEGSSGGGFGMRIYNYGAGGSGATVTLEGCTFRDIVQPGISLVHGWDTVTVDGCTFESCGDAGLACLFSQGRSVLTVTGSRFLSCATGGTLFGIDGTQGGLGTVADSEFCRNEPVSPEFGPRLQDLGGNSFCCAEDVNTDTEVDAVDLAFVLMMWGTDGGKIPAVDVDGSGVVDAQDLSLVVGAWGPCSP